ncbi:NADH-quinone oxidoreductase subunit J family protein [Actinomadura harenae]|uniref:NADH-quinone oxidoreductase subunit J n=1 Tax=Actinomadura harenae TaxID=2483351 RepID=A0A3M2M912_9ACTN|nr:NADH-quinone oxidoreductase subunit J [Actinomadura harenae]RMI43648.1 NADH-quinone oxidoreductase subunit J [Actinomadura harenae]
MLRDAVFWILALAAVGTGVMVFVVDSMARATFALLASFLCVGAVLLLIDLHYLGVLVVLMMIMEMLVMAVFMIMYMMNPAGLMPMKMVHNNRAALGISAGVFVLLTAGVLTVRWPHREGAPPSDPTRALGQAIMGPKMLVMMVIGLAILATMIASVVLATDRGRYDTADDHAGHAAPDQPGHDAHAAHDHSMHGVHDEAAHAAHGHAAHAAHGHAAQGADDHGMDDHGMDDHGMDGHGGHEHGGHAAHEAAARDAHGEAGHGMHGEAGHGAHGGHGLAGGAG